jgi:hypothetical protein
MQFDQREMVTLLLERGAARRLARRSGVGDAARLGDETQARGGRPPVAAIGHAGRIARWHDRRLLLQAICRAVDRACGCVDLRCACFVPDSQVLSGFGDLGASDRA